MIGILGQIGIDGTIYRTYTEYELYRVERDKTSVISFLSINNSDRREAKIEVALIKGGEMPANINEKFYANIIQGQSIITFDKIALGSEDSITIMSSRKGVNFMATGEIS